RSTLSVSSSPMPSSIRPPSPDFLARLTAIVGADNTIASPADQAPYLSEWRDLYVGTSPLIVKPASTDEVSRVLALANAENVAIVPQGGNTGLVGGQIPRETGAEVVLSLRRMRRIRNVDPAGTS